MHCLQIFCEVCLPACRHPALPGLQCAPSEDELKLLRSFLEAGGQQSALADSERFAWLLGQVPRLAPRLRCLLFQYEAPQQLQVRMCVCGVCGTVVGGRPAVHARHNCQPAHVASVCQT